MKEPPEEDLTPGRDKLTLVMITYMRFIAISHYEVIRLGLNETYLDLCDEYLKAAGDCGTFLAMNIHKMKEMPDDWQMRMANFIIEFYARRDAANKMQ